MPEENLFEQLTSEYYELTSSEKKVADFVVANSQAAQLMSISELAQAAGVADATISRFSRRMGYSGYSAFKLSIATASVGRAAANPLSGEVDENDRIPDLAEKLAGAGIDAIRETQALLDEVGIRKAADILLSARQVLCMGQGGSMILAHEAAHLFSTAFSGFFAVDDSHMQTIMATQLTPSDAVLYFSYSGSTTALMDLAKVVKSRKARLILVTRFPNSPGAALADVVLQCGSTESPLQLGSIPARIAQLYLLDVLFSEGCRRNLESCKQRRSRIASALAEKHV